MRALTFEQETRDLKSDSPEYKAIKEKYDKLRAKEAAEENRRRAMVTKIIKLCQPAKFLNRSKLHVKNEKDLTEIGKAARELYDVMKKHGLTTTF